MITKKSLHSLKILFIGLTSVLLFSSCESKKPETKDLSEFGIPLKIDIPANAIIKDEYKAPDDPNYPPLRHVIISDQEQFALHVSMYEKEAERNIQEVIKDDLSFENQYSINQGKKFKIINQESNGYMFEDHSGLDFYYYIIKDGKLITISADQTKTKASKADIQLMFDLAKTSN